MARTKPATPIRREPSSEYTNGASNGYASNGNASHSPMHLVGEKKHSVGEVTADALRTLVPDQARKEGGAGQFLFAVGGIYASL